MLEDDEISLYEENSKLGVLENEIVETEFVPLADLISDSNNISVNRTVENEYINNVLVVSESAEDNIVLNDEFEFVDLNSEELKTDASEGFAAEIYGRTALGNVLESASENDGAVSINDYSTDDLKTVAKELSVTEHGADEEARNSARRAEIPLIPTNDKDYVDDRSNGIPFIPAFDERPVNAVHGGVTNKTPFVLPATQEGLSTMSTLDKEERDAEKSDVAIQREAAPVAPMIPIGDKDESVTTIPNSEASTEDSAPASYADYAGNEVPPTGEHVIVVEVTIIDGTDKDESNDNVITVEPMLKTDEPEKLVEENVPSEENEASETVVEETTEETSTSESDPEVHEKAVEETVEEFIHTDAVHADELVTDEEAEELIEYIDAPAASKGGKMIAINLDTLCDNFEDGETVTIESLKAKKLAPSNAARIKILARGIMSKRLDIIADKFSLQAVKMIALAGGRAEQQR